MADSNVVNTAVETKRTSTVELLFRSAQHMGLRPSWVTPNGLFAVSIDGNERYINFARSPLNSHTGASLAKNKYLTRRILERNSMANIPYMRPRSQTDACDFLTLHDKIIAKPVKGSGSQDIHIVTEPTQLQALDITKYILEKYIAGQEFRYLVLNGVVIGVHRSDYGTSVKEDRELERISYPESQWDPTLVALAVDVARILELRFAAVDFMISPSGRAYVLEVNTAPGLKWFHDPSEGPAVDVAGKFLQSILNDSKNL